tara:strand:- start:25 stop:231 length:207 start_codon:yes stop_codon:yes gene_type:complete
MARLKKPRIGDLVQLNQKMVEDKGYIGRAVGDVGVIVECFGIRCRILWSHGAETTPERGVLEVLNESR